MTDFEMLRQYANASDKSKLQILRNELRPHITTVKGYSEVLKVKVENGDIDFENQNILEWITKINQAGTAMERIVQILTSNADSL